MYVLQSCCKYSCLEEQLLVKLKWCSVFIDFIVITLVIINTIIIFRQMISAVTDVVNFIDNVSGSIMMVPRYTVFIWCCTVVVQTAFSLGIWIFYFPEFQSTCIFSLNALLSSCSSLCFMVPAACSIFPQRW